MIEDERQKPTKLTMDQWRRVFNTDATVAEVMRGPPEPFERRISADQFLFDREYEEDNHVIMDAEARLSDLPTVWTPDERGRRICRLRGLEATLDERANGIRQRLNDFERNVIDVQSPSNQYWRRIEGERVVEMEHKMRQMKDEIHRKLLADLDEYQKMMNNDRREALDRQIARHTALQMEPWNWDGEGGILNEATQLAKRRTRTAAQCSR